MDNKINKVKELSNNFKDIISKDSMDDNLENGNNNINNNLNTKNSTDKIKKNLIPPKYRKDFLLKYKPNLFKKTKNGKYRYNKKCNEEEELCSCNFEQIREYNRQKVIENGEKYYDIHSKIDKNNKLLIETKIDPNDSPCNPDNFSDTIVKPHMRNLIKNYDITKDFKLERDKCLEKMFKLLEIHLNERTHQQVKADLSEYYLYISNNKIIPTLNHKKGIDMYYFINYNSVESLDIKTTRNIWNKEGKEAIKLLYEKQGNERFSSNPRTYIYFSNITDNVDKESISEQFLKVYNNIEFTYNKKKYIVNNCRLIKI